MAKPKTRTNIFAKTDKSWYTRIDWPLLILVTIIVMISLVFISSAVHATSEEGSFYYAQRQAIFFIGGLFIMAIVIMIPYEFIGQYYKIIYGLTIVALLLVKTPLGVDRMGATRWLDIGIGTLQPSEIAKIAIIITFAKFLSTRSNLKDWKQLLLAILHMAIPVALIASQPDLGTSLVFVGFCAAMIFVAGIDFRYIIGTALAGLVSIPIVWTFFLRDYQKTRILNFLNPEQDITGSGYQVYQSKISIGSGRLFGKGLFEGKQNLYGFIPERHTDFIFTVVCEEVGFVGAMVLLLLYGTMLLRCVYLATEARDDFGSYIIIGVMAMFLFQIFVNIGMTMGLLPATGLPLPFMSYGGSAMLTNMIAIGLVLNVHFRRQKIGFN